MIDKEQVFDTTFVLALIGAAAWLPQLISWFLSIFTKPKLRFVPNETVEIGYTSFGPILNNTFAISTSKKDALIEKVILTIVHEKGEKHEFYWKFLDERGGEIISDSGERQEIKKSQPAIALKISTSSLVERKIGFQDVSHQGKLIYLINAAKEKEIYIEKTNPESYKKESIKTKEFLDALDFIKTGFFECWTDELGNFSGFFFGID